MISTENPFGLDVVAVPWRFRGGSVAAPSGSANRRATVPVCSPRQICTNGEGDFLFFSRICVFQIATISGLEILFVGTPKVSQQQQQKQQQRQWRSGHHSNRANMTSKQHIMNGADKRSSVLARAFRTHLGAGRRGAQCWPKAASETLKLQKNLP